MERSRILLWVIVFAAAGIIVWRVGFSVPKSGVPTLARTVEAASPGAAGTAPNEPSGELSPQVQDANSVPVVSPAGDANEASEDQPEGSAPDPNRADERSARGRRSRADVSEPNAVSASGEPMEAVNLKDVEMKKIIDKIAEWTGKTVIPHEEAMKQKITIYAPDKLPRAKALSTIYSALRMKGFVVEEIDDMLFLKPIADAKLGVVPTVGPDEPLAMIENRDQIVRKFFRLSNYPPAQMGEIIQPLVGQYGHVSVDETTGMLLVIDTVGNLMSIGRIIDQFDVPEAGRAVEQFFEIKHGDPAEIVQLLRMLLGEAPTGGRRGGSPSRNVYSSRRPSGTPSRPGAPGAASTAATSVVIGAGDMPIVLIPVPKAKWIIARGSAEDIRQIGEWIQKLDREEPVASEYETVAISYADTREVASRIEEALRDMPGTQLAPSILIRPLEQSRQIMIFGRADLRDMVKKLITEIDIPAGTFETKKFDLKFADPEQIKENLDNLYGEQIPEYDSYYYYRYGRGSRGPDSTTVKVIAFPTMGQVTVIASPENMRKIEKQIEEWDVPLNVEAVKPRIIELRNSDPVQMTQLLTKLFSEDQDSASSNLIRLILYGSSGNERKKIVGPLYGQLTFEDVPGTKKIIVISKIPQAYDVIEQLIYDLDRQEMAEIPNVVPLQYADPEDLAERLNAMFNEPGTTARIRRQMTGLSEYSMDNSQRNQGGGPNAGNNNQRDGGGSEEYTPWWSAGARQRADEEPISNVIGKVRFIPDPRSKSILVLAAPEFQQSLEQTIKQLDTPGKQLLVKAIVVEVEHGSMTSLGVQLATNPSAFSHLGENAVTALGQLTNLATRGSAVASDTALGAEGTGTIVGGTSAVYALIDFLIRTTHAKILNQQTLWTEDNEEAMFFKGQEVAFLAGSTSSANVGVTQNVEFKNVGMTMQVRPSITPERRVDMEIRVDLSQLTTEVINNQPVRSKVESKTNMVVQDGETIMLGGMLFEKDTAVKRKLPLLGDLPLVGGLFQHNDVVQSNSELIVFVTPFVMDEATEEVSEKAKKEIDGSRQRLDELTSQLEETRQELEKKAPKKK
ncbi:MAG TPA: secretin N-terminal domain-containing protein [Sedimentisphaerales bacterium]|nr:secretin N-terminal domain-containing protein [Sedimentisphaerales bacterium]HRS12064.1 secretin N-terminal domain-containing protein [Sedimentisphaerales bacterium]HRV48503.1 secretin N-terminal domain-containing protein [Sedimentisphaerales bacterium]